MYIVCVVCCCAIEIICSKCSPTSFCHFYTAFWPSRPHLLSLSPCGCHQNTFFQMKNEKEDVDSKKTYGFLFQFLKRNLLQPRLPSLAGEKLGTPPFEKPSIAKVPLWYPPLDSCIHHTWISTLHCRQSPILWCTALGVCSSLSGRWCMIWLRCFSTALIIGSWSYRLFMHAVAPLMIRECIERITQGESRGHGGMGKVRERGE